MDTFTASGKFPANLQLTESRSERPASPPRRSGMANSLVKWGGRLQKHETRDKRCIVGLTSLGRNIMIANQASLFYRHESRKIAYCRDVEKSSRSFSRQSCQAAAVRSPNRLERKTSILNFRTTQKYAILLLSCFRAKTPAVNSAGSTSYHQILKRTFVQLFYKIERRGQN